MFTAFLIGFVVGAILGLSIGFCYDDQIIREATAAGASAELRISAAFTEYKKLKAGLAHKLDHILGEN